jgi:chitinase
MALGFNKGDIGLVPTGGKKIVDIYREIARKLFIDMPEFKYMKDDLEELKDIVRNRITAYVSQPNLNPLTFAYTALG